MIADMCVHDLPPSFNGVEMGAIDWSIMQHNIVCGRCFLGIATCVLRPAIKNEVDLGGLWIEALKMAEMPFHGCAVQCLVRCGMEGPMRSKSTDTHQVDTCL